MEYENSNNTEEGNESCGAERDVDGICAHQAIIIYSKLPFGNDMKKRKPKQNKPIKAVTYLDYASATPISASVRAAMATVSGVFANPGGIHRTAVEAKKTITEARKRIAETIDARPEEIVFTSSATESNMLALHGVVDAWKENHEEKPHIIISAIEHPSIIEAARKLEMHGVEVTRIGVNSEGVVDTDAIALALRPTTVLVSVIQANNEIGTIEPIETISKLLRKYRKENISMEYPLLHVDATQAFQYLPVRIVKPEVDLLTLSSGKIYGPRGIALLFIRNNIPFISPMPGGGQEDGRRGGTEATELIVGFAKAMTDAVKIRDKEKARLTNILEQAKKELKKKIPDAVLLGHPIQRIPNNFCFSVPGIESEYLVLALSAKNIFTSSRSSCGTAKKNEDAIDSHVILAIGGNTSDGTIRMSFGRDTKASDVRRAIAVAADAVATWRTWSHAHKNS